MKLPKAVWCAASILVLQGCLARGADVTRLSGGRLLADRYIPAEAYALYARGILLQQSGDLQAAADSFSRAAEYDPDSAELWTRLGAVRCAQHQSASSAFERARALDPDYGPLFRERGRCALSQNRPRDALKDAERAVFLDPDDEGAADLMIQSLDRAGHTDRALAWALSTALTSQRQEAWQRLARLARRHRTPALAALGQRSARSSPSESRRHCDPTTRLELDQALHAAELPLARKLAQACGISPGLLAARAFALGAREAARRQAALVLGADPGNADALIASLGDAQLDVAHAPESPPSALSVYLLAELLARQVGGDAAKTFLQHTRKLPPPADDLERRTRKRVQLLVAAPTGQPQPGENGPAPAKADAGAPTK